MPGPGSDNQYFRPSDWGTDETSEQEERGSYETLDLLYYLFSPGTVIDTVNEVNILTDKDSVRTTTHERRVQSIVGRSRPSKG